MKLKVLGSSSKGNCYVLESSTGQILLIEAGIRLAEVKKQIVFNLANVVGVLISHEHGDHAAYANQYADAAIDVYCSAGTARSFQPHHRINRLKALQQVTIGEFKVVGFDVVHDVAEPFGYLINHAECGTTLFLTDTFYSEFKFEGLNNIILEVNYDAEILEANIESGRLNPSIRNRIETSHMSIQTAMELLEANDISQVNNIVLIHLSDGNSHEVNFKKKIEAATAKTVTVADTGTELMLNKTPF